MVTKATVKLVGELKTGISSSTGNTWKARSILLEWMDSEGTHRAWASLFNDKDDDFSQRGISAGDSVQVGLCFNTRSYRTGFTSTEVRVVSIQKTTLKQDTKNEDKEHD